MLVSKQKTTMDDDCGMNQQEYCLVSGQVNTEYILRADGVTETKKVTFYYTYHHVFVSITLYNPTLVGILITDLILCKLLLNSRPMLR